MKVTEETYRKILSINGIYYYSYSDFTKSLETVNNLLKSLVNK